MPSTPSYKLIIMVVSIGTVGVIVLLTWLFGGFDSSSDQGIQEPTNNILTNIDLPVSCQKIVTIMECTINSLSSKEPLIQYYHQLLSEWNVITDPGELDIVCQEHDTHFRSSVGSSISPSHCL